MQTSIALPIDYNNSVGFAGFRKFAKFGDSFREVLVTRDYLGTIDKAMYFRHFLEVNGDNPEDWNIEFIFPEAWPPDLIADYLEGRTATAA